MQNFYTVRSGDTVYQIATRWGIPMDSLIAANHLVPPYIIYPGQQLAMPPGINFTGVPYYVVQPGDTLFNIAAKYNVVTGRVNRYDLIISANNLLSTLIFPGMKLIIPYAPPGGTGLIAYMLNQEPDTDVLLYNPRTGASSILARALATVNSVPYWSPDARRLAFVGRDDIIYVLEVSTGKAAQIDQTAADTFLDWSTDSSRLVYVKDGKIVIYNVLTNQALSLDRPGATQAQLFPDNINLLYEQQDQLIKERFIGTGMVSRIAQGGPFHNVRLSPDGAFVVYTTPGVSISLIKTIQVSDGTVYDIPGGPEAKNYFPEWDPASAKLAYSATVFREAYYSQIRVSGKHGENDRTWAISDCFATPVTWSPDGNKAAYLSGCNQGEFASQLWVIDLRHPVPTAALMNGRITALKWSPV